MVSDGNSYESDTYYNIRSSHNLFRYILIGLMVYIIK